MASDLYSSFGNPPVQQAPQAQNPREAALNLLKQQGFQVTPQNENDPGALLRMVLQSGQVFQNRLPMAQQAIMQALAGRR
jgi:hypothetical protein